MTTQIHECGGRCSVNVKNNLLPWVLRTLCLEYACSMVTASQSNGLDCAEDSMSGHDIFIKLLSTQH